MQELINGVERLTDSFRTSAPQIAVLPGSNKGLASPQDFLNDADAAQVRSVRRRRCDQGNRRAKESDLKGLGRRVELSLKGRVEPKGYLHLHVLNTSDEKALSIR